MSERPSHEPDPRTAMHLIERARQSEAAECETNPLPVTGHYGKGSSDAGPVLRVLQQAGVDVSHILR